MSRKYIRKDIELAAALLQIPVEHDDGSIGPIVDLKTAKTLSAEQIRSLWHRDHCPIRKEQNGPDEPWNITWRPIAAHRKKTAKVDRPAIAKSARIAKATAETRHLLLAKVGQAPESEAGAAIFKRPGRRWASRPIDGSKNSPWRKPMRGPAVRRTP